MRRSKVKVYLLEFLEPSSRDHAILLFWSLSLVTCLPQVVDLKFFIVLAESEALYFHSRTDWLPPTPYFRRNIFSVFGMLIAFRLIFKNHFTFFINVWGKRQFRISLGVKLFYNPISVKFEIWQYLGRWRRSFTMDMWIFFKLFVFGI